MIRRPIKGITVSVGYDDLLKITLHRNARHLTEIVVVTHPDDVATQEVVKTVPSARCHLTTAFYEHGAKFNKGLAIEQGFDELGRDGWILIFDADIVLPERLYLPPLKRGCLYGARRRMLKDITQWRPDLDWKTLPTSDDKVIAGYFQLFDADDPSIEKYPWYDVTFKHAGGCDGYFQSRWPQGRRVWTQAEVLHIGPRDTNWFGRTSARADGKETLPDSDMRAYLAYKGWHGMYDASAPAVEEHVKVPGHDPSGYQLKGRGDR